MRVLGQAPLQVELFFFLWLWKNHHVPLQPPFPILQNEQAWLGERAAGTFSALESHL